MYTPYTVLNVQDDPVFRNLLQKTLRSGNGDFEVVDAHNPEEGMELIHKRHAPYSVIWSGHKFNGSRLDGIDFLGFCEQYSSVSSRVLCSDLLGRTELESMVRVGDIHSYISKLENSNWIEPILSSKEIGIEYYKINICGEFFDRTSFVRQDSFEVISKRLDSINESFEDMGTWGFENRAVDKENLLARTQAILNNSNLWIAEQYLLIQRIKCDEKSQKALKILDKVQGKIIKLSTNINRRKLFLEISVKKAYQTTLKTSEVDSIIQRLKNEL